MSAGRKGPRRRGSRRGSAKVLVFGEDENDTKALRELIEALRTELAGRVLTLREPLVLIKNAKPEDVPERAQRIARAVDIQRAVHDVAGVFAHEDQDGIEPNHEKTCAKIEVALKSEGCVAHAVVPAWELEAWWFMWPEQVQGVRPRSWRSPNDYIGREVGLVRNAKEELKKRVRPKDIKPEKRKNFPDYAESDAPSVARLIREAGLVRKPGAKSLSYARFIRSVDACADEDGNA